MQEDESVFPLLSLPWLPLMTVMKNLSKEDKQAAAGACRCLAAAVSAASQGTKLTVRSNTGWKGLQQIHDSKTITCKTLEFVGNLATEKPATGALHIFLKSDTVLKYSFPGIQRVVLNAHPLPCLLPTNLASILPDLKELTLNIDDYEQYANLQPLPYCSSLTALSFCAQHGNIQHLPSSYHTHHDLQKQLPNITFLHVSHDRCKCETAPYIVTMIKAWGEQLTRLDLETYLEPEHLQHCARLQSLTWGFRPANLKTSYIPTSLLHLILHSYIRAGELETILQLPFLQTLECRSIVKDDNQWLPDWSGHPCTLRQLKVLILDFSDLAKLPLQSLKSDGGLYIKGLTLPDPLSSNSMPDVRHAVQHVKEAGVTIEGLERWQCERWKDISAAPHLDMASAELVLLASTVVKPPSRYVCDWASMPHYQQTITAVVDWMSGTVRDIVFSLGANLPDWLWQALTSCSLLKYIKWRYDYMFVSSEILGQVLLASEFIVEANLTPLLLEVECREETSASKKAMEDAAVRLKAKLPQHLPSSVMLKEVSWKSPLLSICLQPASHEGSMDSQ